MTGPVFAPTFMPSNSTAFTNAPTLLPPGPFSGSSPLPTHLFPYFASPNGTLFAQTPPGTFPSVSFNANGSMFVTQPQALVSGNSVNFPQFNPGGMPGVSTNSLFSGPPTATVVLATPMSSEMGNTSVAPSFLNSPCFTACGTNVTPIYTDVLSASMSTSSSGIPMASMSGLTSSMLTMPSTTMVYSSLPLASVSSASNLVTCPRILTSSESSGPIALKSKLELQGAKSTTSAANSVNSNLLALESAEFHRGFILEAIDKLRERKARPDFERISCLLKRQHSIPPTETQLCLGRLAETGAVVCVDYKGNLSYRNPSKWRKTAISGLGMMNPPSVSRRILDAMRFLLSSTAPKGPDESFPQSPVGFTSLQIERALQQRTASNLLPTSSASSSGIESGPQSSASSSSSSSSSSKAPTEGTAVTTTTSTTAPPLCSELTGTNLRISLEREATYGKLARLPNGQYVLDETGERKKSMGVGPGYPLSSINFLNKRPLPPKGSLLYPGGGNKVGPMPPPFVKPAIAPALDTSGKSPLHKPTNVVSIAPNGRGIVLRRPPNLGKRGRPPGGKVRKILSAAAVTNSASTASVKPAILPASSEPSACIEKVSLLTCFLSVCFLSLSPLSHSLSGTDRQTRTRLVQLLRFCRLFV
ncbi:unnamed protein product [Dibothriocephalus latus]|uniref:SAMD1-like winged helix (WH) domain-containing protein n=1 Tax=Dibothriocephalus latus TaxID=60516 RepID=A0A3P7RGB7_DIBLA|nr:unnamed protein product [Dibothriocephalus latus]